MRVLFVEDNPTTSLLLPAFADAVREIVVAHDAKEAAEQLKTGPFSAVVIDWILGVTDGLDVARAVRGRGDSTPIVMVSAAGSADFRVLEAQTAALGSACAIQKPYAVEDVMAACKRLGARTVAEMQTAANLQPEG